MTNDKPTFVTQDNHFGSDPTDQAVLSEMAADAPGIGVGLTATAGTEFGLGAGVTIDVVEQLDTLAEAARLTSEHFQALFADLSTERAAFVRHLRVDTGHSWRGVARACYDAWPDLQEHWSPPSNQIAGMALCDIAATSMGEDYMVAPWN